MFRVAIIDTLNSRVHAVDLKHKPPTVADFVSLLEASNLFGNLHNVVGICVIFSLTPNTEKSTS